MLVTPEMAREYLQNNPNNRKIKEVRVQEFVYLIEKGKFHMTHQGIAFKANGELLDGQHRLLAIIKANKAVMLQVSIYEADEIPTDELMPIDMGVARSATDIYKLSGFDDVVLMNMVPTAKQLIRKMGKHGSYISAEYTKEFIQTHYALFSQTWDIVSCGGKVIRTPPHYITSSVLLALANRKEKPEALSKFIEAYRYNETRGMDAYNLQSVLKYKDKMRNGTRLRQLKGGGEIQSALEITQGAIHAFCNNARFSAKIYYPIDALKQLSVGDVNANG